MATVMAVMAVMAMMTVVLRVRRFLLGRPFLRRLVFIFLLWAWLLFVGGSIGRCAAGNRGEEKHVRSVDAQLFDDFLLVLLLVLRELQRLFDHPILLLILVFVLRLLGTTSLFAPTR